MWRWLLFVCDLVVFLYIYIYIKLHSWSVKSLLTVMQTTVGSREYKRGLQWGCSQIWGLPYNGICTFWSYVFSIPVSEARWPLCWRELIHRHGHCNGVITKTHAVYKYELQHHTDLLSLQVNLSHTAAQISPIRHSLILSYQLHKECSRIKKIQTEDMMTWGQTAEMGWFYLTDRATETDDQWPRSPAWMELSNK